MLFHDTFKKMCSCVAREEKGLLNSSELWFCPVDKRRELELTKCKMALRSPDRNLAYDNALIHDNRKLKDSVKEESAGSGK